MDQFLGGYEKEMRGHFFTKSDMFSELSSKIRYENDLVAGLKVGGLENFGMMFTCLMSSKFYRVVKGGGQGEGFP